MTWTCFNQYEKGVKRFWEDKCLGRRVSESKKRRIYMTDARRDNGHTAAPRTCFFKNALTKSHLANILTPKP